MGQGLTSDYIRTYLGLMGSGKTTQALVDVEKRPRVIVYSPGCSNERLKPWPWLPDTPQHLAGLSRYMSLYPKFRIEKRSFPTGAFRALSVVRGCTIIFDDLAAIRTNSQERNEFEAFIRTVRHNGNNVIITTHRANDLSPLIRNIGTSFFYVGPGTRSKYELDILYQLTNYPIGYDEFVAKMDANPPIEIKNKRIAKMAGVFAIRRV